MVGCGDVHIQIRQQNETLLSSKKALCLTIISIVPFSVEGEMGFEGENSGDADKAGFAPFLGTISKARK